MMNMMNASTLLQLQYISPNFLSCSVFRLCWQHRGGVLDEELYILKQEDMMVHAVDTLRDFLAFDAIEIKASQLYLHVGR